MQALPDKPIDTEVPLQLLLFVDRRPSSREQIRQIRKTLKDLQMGYPFELQVIDVSEQPYMAEHFRLIATPSLVKIHPEPRQTLTGSNLIEQLQHWWIYWQRSAEEYLESLTQTRSDSLPTTEAKPNQDGDEANTAAVTVKTAVITGATATGTDGVASSNLTLPKGTTRGGIQSVATSAEFIRLSDEVFRLKQEKEELEHQLRFKDQIIAMLAHDLRNPLTAASIALETLEMGHDGKEGWAARLTPALTAQLLKHARTQTRAIDRMVTDILQAARGANAELQIQPKQLNLGQLCLDVLTDLSDRFQAKSQQVEKDIPSDLPMVLADGERVRQVIVNLLDNAIKYTACGGTISISILHRTAQKVQVSVCDNGPGIPEENRERVFEDHFRLERDEAKDGYGIGLSLCQRIIRAHYGQIWVDSTENEGSCFHFTLPVFRL